VLKVSDKFVCPGGILTPEEKDDIVHVKKSNKPVVLKRIGFFGDCLKAESSKGCREVSVLEKGGPTEPV